MKSQRIPPEAALLDHTEKDNQQQYLMSTDLYRQLIHHLPDTLVLVFDKDLRYQLVEGTLPEAHGYPADTLIGKTLYDVASAERLAQLEPLYRAVLNGQTFTFEDLASQRASDRLSERIYSVHLSMLHGEEPAGVVTIRDITEAKRREMQVLQNELLFRNLFEQNNDAVLIFSLDGRLLTINPRVTSLFGYSLQEMARNEMLVQELLSYQKLSTAQLLEALHNGSLFPMLERKFTTRDGTPFYAEVTLALIYDLEGRPSHIQYIIRDITERKRIESQLGENVERLTMLHQVDAELADRLSMEYVLSMALDAAIRLSGANIGFISLLDDENMMHIAKMVGEYPPGLEENYLRQRRGIIGRVMRTHEAEIIFDVRRDPDYEPTHPKTIAQMAIPLVSQERLIGVLNLESSRTDRFSYEVLDFLKLVTARIAVAIDNARLYNQSETQLAQLRDLYSQVSNLEQIKTDMIRIASHDLRNPLSAILGFIELLELDLSLVEDPGEMRSHLDNMERAARRIEKIIDDILSLEIIEESVRQKIEKYVNLTDLVYLIYEEVEPQARLNSRNLFLEAPDGPLMVKGHEPQLREAIANLIGNAIKYTYPNGNIEVRLHTSGRKAVFEVQDNGIGIKPEYIDKLFQPFFRVTSDETQHIEGTGLGLHLVKKIIERHSGKMLVRSEYGEGSTFGFSLPILLE
ncbi:MAG: hypothetical protein OHK0046_19970 [Anaerolineae bacterium]